MAKKTDKTTFYCKECGYETSKWEGKCPSCGAWDTFTEVEKVKSIGGLSVSPIKNDIKPIPLSKVIESDTSRFKSGIGEFDNLLGGGIVKGSLTLIGGAPGIGKSTLLLQLVKNLSDKGLNVLYVSGEESLSQIKLRASRIGSFKDNATFISETDMDSIISVVIRQKPAICVFDSIQTFSIDSIDLVPGNPSTVKSCTNAICRICKEYNISSFIVGHVTKDGQVAGPKMLEHMVDTVLYFEDDELKNLRVLRCKKNRFGSSDALAVFEMMSDGLKEVKNPSEIFMDGQKSNATGCVVTCIIESGRPILLEVQALVTKSSLGIPRRNINGSDINRLNLLCAIIEKRMNIPLYQYDIYVNITGGLKIKDTSIDLAIIMAIISSYKDKSLGADCIYCGEVGLSGEVRSVNNANLRVKEATKLGYKKIFIPKSNLDTLDDKILKMGKDIEIKGIANVLL